LHAVENPNKAKKKKPFSAITLTEKYTERDKMQQKEHFHGDIEAGK